MISKNILLLHGRIRAWFLEAQLKSMLLTRLLIILSGIFLYSFPIHSQDIVVNEYFNGGSQNEEWTELVVIKDNLDLRGWFLGDNNAGTSSWQPKIKFENNPLWQNLRSGTLIQIDHASNAAGCDDVTDVDKTDGFIRVCCRNTTYFSGGTPNTLFLADDGDFVQIVDPSGRMVHAIGHDEDPGSSVEGGTCFTTSANWTNTTTARSATRPCGNFTFYRFPMESPTTLKMIAGTTADFSSGMQTNGTNPFIDTTDTPFEGIGNGGANNGWLIELRAPGMEAQDVCPTRGANGSIAFNWQPAEDGFPSDNSLGYMVIRNSTGDFPLPEQGKEYAVGATLGTGNQAATVVRLLTGSGQSSFSENPGPGTFFYRVLAYRYRNTTGFSHPTRGRSYNTTNFVKVNSLEAPVIPVKNDTLCGPGIAVLSVDPPAGIQANWFTSPTGPEPIASGDTLRIAVNQSRSFWVGISGSGFCNDSRVEVKAVFQPLEVSYSAPDSICEGTPASFFGNATAGIRYQWELINPPLGVTSSGHDSLFWQVSIPFLENRQWLRFRVRSRNEEGCVSPWINDSLTTVPFNPVLTLRPSTPAQGDSVQIFPTGLVPNYFVSGWETSGGTVLSESPGELLVLAGTDTIKAGAIIQTLLPDDGRFCRVIRNLKTVVLPEETPLRPINNLITTNGDGKNDRLDFDRREVRNLEIYDRWGKKILKKEVYRNDWLPSASEGGTYFFQAEVKEPGASGFEKLNGWIQVLR